MLLLSIRPSKFLLEVLINAYVFEIAVFVWCYCWFKDVEGFMLTLIPSQNKYQFQMKKSEIAAASRLKNILQ